MTQRPVDRERIGLDELPRDDAIRRGLPLADQELDEPAPDEPYDAVTVLGDRMVLS